MFYHYRCGPIEYVVEAHVALLIKAAKAHKVFLTSDSMTSNYMLKNYRTKDDLATLKKTLEHSSKNA